MNQPQSLQLAIKVITQSSRDLHHTVSYFTSDLPFTASYGVSCFNGYWPDHTMVHKLLHQLMILCTLDMETKEVAD